MLVMGWVGLNWIKENGPMANSELFVLFFYQLSTVAVNGCSHAAI